jgi:hypothetical protein
MRTFPRIPKVGDDALQRYLRDLSVTVQSEFRDRVPDNVGGQFIHLVSPDGSVFSVTVANDGTLSATKVLG